MENTSLTPDTTFPYRLFRFAHKRTLDAVSSSYFAVVSKDRQPIGLILVVDIAERWHHAREAATTFWQIFVREFNHSESRSSLTRYEEALRELNKAVVKTEEKVQQPISVAAAMLEGSQIHFSTIGTSRILLIRGGKFSDVTAGAEKSGNQFAAVTSGDVDSSDIICVANQNLYEFLAAEPDEMWAASSADDLSREVISRAQNSETALNCVLIQYSPDQPAQSTLYWEESEKRYPISLPKLSLPTLPKMTLPQFKKFKGFKWPFKFTAIKIPQLASLRSAVKQAFGRLAGLSPRIRIIAAIVAVLITGLIGINSFRQSAEPETPQVSVAEEFRATAPEASIDYLLTLVGSSRLAELSDQDLSDITAIALERGIEVINTAGHINELPEKIVSISSIGTSLFILSETGQLWQIDGSGVLKQLDHLFKVVSPKDIVAFSESSLVVTDQLGNIWHYNGQNNGPVAIALPSALADGEKLIAKYGANLYVYSSSQNAIYRQVNFAGELTVSNPYSNLSALSNAKLWGWAINGDFVGLTEQKSLVGWRLNQITVGPVATPLAEKASQVVSDQEDLLIVQTKQLISAYSGSGALLWQKFYLSGEPVTDVAVTSTTLWLTIDKKVYSLAI